MIDLKKEEQEEKHFHTLKVGITGSSGNIGSTLQKGLCDKYNLFLYDIREIKPLCEATFIKVDLAEPKQLVGIFDGLDVLIHLAGNPLPSAQKKDTYKNNFELTSYVFEEARRAGVKKIVYASSNHYHDVDISNVFNKISSELITLDMPPSSTSLYGESKVFGENLGRHLSYMGMQFVAMRIGWTVPQDNPFVIHCRDYMRAMFCSKRDLVQAFDKAISIKTTFLSAFVISNNNKKVFDLTETRKVLGFEPEDNAENYF